MSAPGWYPDPQDPRRLRWWDGQSWTDHLATHGEAPGGPGAPPSAGAGPAAYATPPGAAPYGMPGGPPPKKGTNPWLIGGLIAGAAVLLLIILIVPWLVGRSTTSATGSPATTVAPTTTVAGGRPTTTVSDLDDLADAAGIPVLDEEGFVTHTHALVLIEVDGDEIVIPAEIGIDEDGGEIAAVHTHDESGAVHVESPTENDSYTLGQFLILWGVGSTEDDVCQYFVDQPDCTIEVDVVGASSVGLSEDDPLGPWPDEPAVRADGLDTVLDQGAIVTITITST